MHSRTVVGESGQSEDGEKESRNCGNNIVHQGQRLVGWSVEFAEEVDEVGIIFYRLYCQDAEPTITKPTIPCNGTPICFPSN